MVFLSLVGAGIVVVLLCLVAGVSPRASVLSTYELERRKKEGNASATEELRRQAAAEDIVLLLHVAEVVLVVLLTGILIAQWSVLGFVVAVVIAFLYRRFATIEFIRTTSQRIYEENDMKLIQFTEKHRQLPKILGTLTGGSDKQSLGSREELEHLIDESAGILTADEKKLIKSNLHFGEKLVESVMTPRGVIEAIDEREVLGPIVLDQLHRTGHSRFPVTSGDIDHIVGVLHIRDLLALEQKTSQSAKESMEKKVYYINQTQTLQHALAAFLSTRHHLFVVVNEYRETAGIITLEDCMEALIGRKIVDEFDTHEDLRVVAERESRHNNNPPHATNV